eukprot:CAMPEP_0115074098 /NCGR_PEP_ID=MMETSP0227-20121206/15158_1 /TAXON_ID=89957 /ORGANISM="Polarella glacialis, Strain CCMP 1383" /LENGTH=225 /DNA_ID=CAMNT_0002461041 /DNA_START=128 /DNA_END=803 /DNA_ORIENTATION=+
MRWLAPSPPAAPRANCSGILHRRTLLADCPEDLGRSPWAQLESEPGQTSFVIIKVDTTLDLAAVDAERPALGKWIFAEPRMQVETSPVLVARGVQYFADDACEVGYLRGLRVYFSRPESTSPWKSLPWLDFWRWKGGFLDLLCGALSCHGCVFREAAGGKQPFARRVSFPMRPMVDLQLKCDAAALQLQPPVWKEVQAQASDFRVFSDKDDALRRPAVWRQAESG